MDFTITETKRYIKCPNCKQKACELYPGMEDRVHKTFCDNCGEGYSFKYENKEVVELTSTCEYFEESYVLLERGEVVLIVKGRSYSDKGEMRECGHEYLYNEHTCPTNYLNGGDVLAIIDLKDLDCDPHGVFKYVKTVPLKDNKLVMNNEDEQEVQSIEGCVDIFGKEFMDILKKHGHDGRHWK